MNARAGHPDRTPAPNTRADARAERFYQANARAASLFRRVGLGKLAHKQGHEAVGKIRGNPCKETGRV